MRTKRLPVCYAFSLGLLTACTELATPPVVDVPLSDVANPQSSEGEVFGNVYQNGARAPNIFVRLTPDPATRSRLQAPWDSIMWADSGLSSGLWMFEWSDPKDGGRCGDLSNYLAHGSRPPEVHRAGPNLPPAIRDESHCVRPGTYQMEFAQNANWNNSLRRLWVDYLQVEPSLVTNTSASVSEYVERLVYDEDASVTDLTVNYEIGGGSSHTDTLDIENALSVPTKTSFANQLAPSGTTEDWFRYSIARTRSTWSRDSRGKALYRIYWDRGNRPTYRSSFYNSSSGGYSAIRLHRYDAEVFRSRTDTVGLEVLTPTGSILDAPQLLRPVTVAACIGIDHNVTWRMTDQVFELACGTGAGLQYRWRTDDGGPWTSYSTSPTYEFMGHGTAGSHQITAQAWDPSTGATTSYGRQLTVRDSQIVLTGRTYVTDKATNLYESNASLFWFEKFDHDTQWWPGTSEPRPWMYRIWPAGQYTVDLRQPDSTASVLRRGRLHITVCNPPSSCEQLAPPLRGPAPSAPAVEGWGLFGAGPWLSWGTANAIRFYDLWGAHDVASRFADITWIEDATGQVGAAGAGSTLSWRQRALKAADARAVDFTLATTESGSPFTFSLALDPDLGPNAADDQTGFDATRSMVYVFDADRAVGFLLRDAQGRNAVRGVTQYGLARRPPTTAAATWSATRARGVDLLSGRSDVQLLLTMPAQAGPVTWTFVLVRAATAADLRARADAVLAELAPNQ